MSVGRKFRKLTLWLTTASLMETFGALASEVVEANSLKNMVVPCGLEPQTSTVSKVRGSRTRHTNLWVGNPRTECPAMRCPTKPLCY